MYISHVSLINVFSAGTVIRRQNQIPTYEDDPLMCNEIIKIFIMTIDPYHWCTNEAERAS